MGAYEISHLEGRGHSPRRGCLEGRFLDAAMTRACSWLQVSSGAKDDTHPTTCTKKGSRKANHTPAERHGGRAPGHRTRAAGGVGSWTEGRGEAWPGTVGALPPRPLVALPGVSPCKPVPFLNLEKHKPACTSMVHTRGSQMHGCRRLSRPIRHSLCHCYYLGRLQSAPQTHQQTLASCANHHKDQRPQRDGSHRRKGRRGEGRRWD